MCLFMQRYISLQSLDFYSTLATLFSCISFYNQLTKTLCCNSRNSCLQRVIKVFIFEKNLRNNNCLREIPTDTFIQISPRYVDLMSQVRPFASYVPQYTETYEVKKCISFAGLLHTIEISHAGAMTTG